MNDMERQSVLEDWFLETLFSNVFKGAINECQEKGQNFLQNSQYFQIYIVKYGYFCPYVRWIWNITQNQGLFHPYPYVSGQGTIPTREFSVKLMNKKDNAELFDLLVNTQNEIKFIIQTIKRIEATYNLTHAYQWIRDYLPAIVIDKYFVELRNCPSKDFNFTSEDNLALTKFKQILQINTVKSLLLN